jgi:hypothetical protein
LPDPVDPCNRRLFLFVVFRYLVLYAPFSTDEPIAKITAQQADDHLGDFNWRWSL